MMQKSCDSNTISSKTNNEWNYDKRDFTYFAGSWLALLILIKTSEKDFNNDK